MERLMTVRIMKLRYGCSTPTARKYIRQMTPHMENPVCAPWGAFEEWEARRTVVPAVRKHRNEIIYKGRVHVPRKREG